MLVMELVDEVNEETSSGDAEDADECRGRKAMRDR